MKLFKEIILFTIVLWGMVMFFMWLDTQNRILMNINYCWDSNGEHYIAPDERCRN